MRNVASGPSYAFPSSRVDACPQFNFWNGEPDPDDFRLKPGRPARRAGVLLPLHLRALDDDAPRIAAPDIGAYQTDNAADLPQS
jgi:hypothetical protein